MWDIGGGDKLKPLLVHYYPGTHLVIFVIDGNCQYPTTLDYNRSELKLAMGHEDLKNAALLVVVNKIDLEVPALEEIRKQIEFDSLDVKNKRMIAISAKSVKDG